MISEGQETETYHDEEGAVEDESDGAYNWIVGFTGVLVGLRVAWGGRVGCA